MRLATGLRPDPLGELERSPRPPSRNLGEGCLLLRGREGKEWEKGRKGVGRGKGGREGEGGKGGVQSEGERREGKGRRGRARHVCVPINKKKLPLHRWSSPPTPPKINPSYGLEYTRFCGEPNELRISCL